MMDFNDGYHLNGYGMGDSASWFIVLVLFLAATALVILMVRRYAPPAGHTEPAALDILKTRYAKGELTQAEFEHMRDHIS
jgi:putative membrane protein